MAEEAVCGGRGRQEEACAYLEEALAALAGAHAVVLAGGVVPAHGARALARRRAPVRRRRQAAALAQQAGRGGGGCEAERWEGEHGRPLGQRQPVRMALERGGLAARGGSSQWQAERGGGRRVVAEVVAAGRAGRWRVWW